MFFVPNELVIDCARVRCWGLAQAVLSVWWSIEDFGHLEDYDVATLACAELLAAIKKNSAALRH